MLTYSIDDLSQEVTLGDVIRSRTLVEEELIKTYVPEAEVMTFNEALELACIRDEQAARELKGDFDGTDKASQ